MMLPKVLWNSILAMPALAGTILMVSAPALAGETQVGTEADALLNTQQVSSVEMPSVEPMAEPVAEKISAASPAVQPAEAIVELPPAVVPVAVEPAAAPVQIAQSAEQPASGASLDQIMRYSGEGNSGSLSQVTSITQLSDVRPTDWAYQALQSLVERYGCIAGYPDGTYKGQRAMTRFEFAAGMNACLDRISELIAASTADLATKEDLATLQRLQEEFAAELAALRGRVDGLEARVSELEANQFSTTTKLSGETIFAVGVPFGGADLREPDDDDSVQDQVIAGYRVRLNFDTSFTGEDLLRARLQARDFGDFDSFQDNTSWQWSSSSGDDTVKLDDLVYTFPVGPAQIIIGANSIGDSDFVATTVSPFDSGGQGSLTNGLGTPPQYNFIPGGTGIGAIIGLGDNLSLDFGYAAGNAGDPNLGEGLFNGDYGLIGQLSVLTDFVDAAFMYSNSYSKQGFGSFGGFNLGNFEGIGQGVGATSGVFGDTDDSGEFDDDDDIRAEVANIYGAQVNFKLGDFAQIGGGAMYMPVRTLGVGDYRVWSYHGTLAFPDLGGDGNLLGFVAGVPPRVSGTSGGLFGRQDASFMAEAFYRLRLNDNISITPGVVFLNDPGNNNDREDAFVGAIRTTFTF